MYILTDFYYVHGYRFISKSHHVNPSYVGLCSLIPSPPPFSVSSACAGSMVTVWASLRRPCQRSTSAISVTIHPASGNATNTRYSEYYTLCVCKCMCSRGMDSCVLFQGRYGIILVIVSDRLICLCSLTKTGSVKEPYPACLGVQSSPTLRA